MSLEEDGYAALIGWTVLTPAEGFSTDVEMTEEEPALIEVGEITDFLDIPNNPCIEVETENGAIMIPLHEDLILSVDPEYQEIIMQIPAGLI
jgi:ribosomal 30S subunit maturation factor RimM